jgi:hypothetical protein
MKTSTMVLLAGGAAVGYYLYKRQQASVTVPVPVAVATPGAIAVPTTVPVSGYLGDDGTELAADDDGNVTIDIDDDYGSAVPYGWGPSWGVMTGGGRRGGHGGRGHGGHGGGHGHGGRR